jgi:hypothetical protein
LSSVADELKLQESNDGDSRPPRFTQSQQLPQHLLNMRIRGLYLVKRDEYVHVLAVTVASAGSKKSLVITHGPFDRV